MDGMGQGKVQIGQVWQVFPYTARRHQSPNTTRSALYPTLEVTNVKGGGGGGLMNAHKIDRDNNNRAPPTRAQLLPTPCPVSQYKSIETEIRRTEVLHTGRFVTHYSHFVHTSGPTNPRSIQG